MVTLRVRFSRLNDQGGFACFVDTPNLVAIIAIVPSGAPLRKLLPWVVSSNNSFNHTTRSTGSHLLILQEGATARIGLRARLIANRTAAVSRHIRTWQKFDSRRKLKSSPGFNATRTHYDNSRAGRGGT